MRSRSSTRWSTRRRRSSTWPAGGSAGRWSWRGGWAPRSRNRARMRRPACWPAPPARRRCAPPWPAYPSRSGPRSCSVTPTTCRRRQSRWRCAVTRTALPPWSRSGGCTWSRATTRGHCPRWRGTPGATLQTSPTLSRLADGTLQPARAVALRRHVGNCPACEDVLDTLAKGRRLCAGLPVIAMPDEAREAMLERVTRPRRHGAAVRRRGAARGRGGRRPQAGDLPDPGHRGARPGRAARGRRCGADQVRRRAVRTRRAHADDQSLAGVACLLHVGDAVGDRFVDTPRPPDPSRSRTPSSRPTQSATTVAVNPAIAISPASGPRGTTITVRARAGRPATASPSATPGRCRRRGLPRQPTRTAGSS